LGWSIKYYKTMDKEQQQQLEEFKKRIEKLGNNYRLKEKNRRHERGASITLR